MKKLQEQLIRVEQDIAEKRKTIAMLETLLEEGTNDEQVEQYDYLRGYVEGMSHLVDVLKIIVEE